VNRLSIAALISLFLSFLPAVSDRASALSAPLQDDMALVPAGEFLMGSPVGSDGLPDEQPQRLVFSAAFWIDP
jgi:formylglycine-generating enzyme required for sulfatase activity